MSLPSTNTLERRLRVLPRSSGPGPTPDSPAPGRAVGRGPVSAAQPVPRGIGAILHLAAAALMLAAGCDSVQPLETTTLSNETPAVHRGDEEQWPGWRGGPRRAVAPGDAPLQWRVDEVGVRWVSDVPGAGNSSPVVWDDRIFLTSVLPRDGRGELALLCYDRQSGQMRWLRELGPHVGRTHQKNGFASATPVTDGRRVIAFFGSAGLFCYDLGGRRLWRADLGEVDHQWGVASSPILYGDLVIQLCDGEASSYIAAFHKASGRLIWKTPRESCGNWSTPALVNAQPGRADRMELVVNGTGSSHGAPGDVIAYDPIRGHQLWRVAGTSDIPCPTPIVGDALVISTSGSGGEGPVLAIRAGGRGDVTASHVLWRLPHDGPYVPTGLILRNRLFLISDGGVASCYDIADGSQLWRKRLRESFSASLIAAGDRIYATSEPGCVHVFAAADRYEPLAASWIPERCLATPAIAHGELYIRGQHRLYCIARPTAAAASAD